MAVSRRLRTRGMRDSTDCQAEVRQVQYSEYSVVFELWWRDELTSCLSVASVGWPFLQFRVCHIKSDEHGDS